MSSTSSSSTSSRWDTQAIKSGASVALVFAVPFSIAARIFSDSGIAVFFSLCASIGFLLGAAVAAWHQQRRTPLSHAIVTAALSYIIPQTIFVIVKLARGGEVRWLGVFFNLTITLTVGVIGGFIGSTMQRTGAAPRGRRS
jgi:hypothetical protein